MTMHSRETTIGRGIPAVLSALFLLAVSTASIASTETTAPESTNAAVAAKWARPITLEGVPNLHKVSDALYRSAQPTAQGMKNLKALGIKTVVNLRSYSTDKDEIGRTGLQSDRIPMNAWHTEKEDAIRFLKIAADPGRQPVLVHCMHGADRTGSMCAVYRVAVQGWSKEDAIAEMTGGGFGFHKIWTNLPEWILKLDFDTIRKEAGITNTPLKAAQQ